MTNCNLFLRFWAQLTPKNVSDAEWLRGRCLLWKLLLKQWPANILSVFLGDKTFSSVGAVSFITVGIMVETIKTSINVFVSDRRSCYRLSVRCSCLFSDIFTACVRTQLWRRQQTFHLLTPQRPVLHPSWQKAHWLLIIVFVTSHKH